MKKNRKHLDSVVMSRLKKLYLLAWITGITAYSCMATNAYDDKRPHEHFCPITREVMKDPVVALDGHSYEKEAIKAYFKSAHQPKSPLTGLSLSTNDLVDNQALKSMIMDWKPGSQGGLSALEGRCADDIAQRVREEFDKSAHLLDLAKGKNIVAFLGNTGAGKSTLVNLLAGKEIRVSDDNQDYVLVNPDDATAMIIGTGGSSETLYPKSIDVEGLRFFDLPGFNDTDGSERNLVNAAFIRKILLDAASVRLVFVVGQDQFTADRSASVRQMFNCLQQLFVVEQNTNLVNNGIFVATKVTCGPQAKMSEFLLKKTNSSDKAVLMEQLEDWSAKNRLCRLFHPLLDTSNAGIREQILELVKKTAGVKIRGINVSALYPPDTKQDLERMFVSILEKGLAERLQNHPATLTAYDEASAYYTSNDFWSRFSADICEKDAAIGLLKEFCSIPYVKALTDLEQANGGRLQEYIQTLKSQRQERVKDIEKRTAQRTKAVISALVPAPVEGNFVTFDFAYHRDFHEQVCGSHSIVTLATDPLEQAVVRSCYASLISEHSHSQMMHWQEKFSGLAEIKGLLAALKESQDADHQRIENLTRQLTELQVEKQATTEWRLSIPLVARGHEQIYQRFLNGVLIYRPDGETDTGRINLPIASLLNPLVGTFDLSQCGDTGNYLSISTGYRKEKKAKNANKVEIWFTPRFLVEKELQGPAAHFKEIFPAHWPDTAPVGIIWSWGGWDNLSNNFDFLTTKSMEDVRKKSLLENWNDARMATTNTCHTPQEANIVIQRIYEENFMFIL